MIEDYETVEKPLGSKKGNPRYIYFIGNPNYIDEWFKKSENARKSYENFLVQVDDGNPWYYNDDDDDDDDDEGYSFKDFSYDSANEQEIPLSLYWFVDEYDRSSLESNVHDQTQVLKNNIQSMDENIKQLISLLKNKQK